MRPFNLEAAIRGEPICTRDGRPVVWGAYNPEAANENQIVCWIDGYIRTFYANGAYLCAPNKYKSDIFMAPRKVKLWRRTYRLETGTYRTVTAACEGDANGPCLWMLHGGQSWVTEWEAIEVDE